MGRRVGRRLRFVRVVLLTRYVRDAIVKKFVWLKILLFEALLFAPISEWTSTFFKTTRSSRADTAPTSDPTMSHLSPVVELLSDNSSPFRTPKSALKFSDISAVSMVTDDVTLIVKRP